MKKHLFIQKRDKTFISCTCSVRSKIAGYQFVRPNGLNPWDQSEKSHWWAMLHDVLKKLSRHLRFPIFVEPSGISPGYFQIPKWHLSAFTATSTNKTNEPRCMPRAGVEWGGGGLLRLTHGAHKRFDKNNTFCTQSADLFHLHSGKSSPYVIEKWQCALHLPRKCARKTAGCFKNKMIGDTQSFRSHNRLTAKSPSLFIWLVGTKCVKLCIAWD